MLQRDKLSGFYGNQVVDLTLTLLLTLSTFKRLSVSMIFPSRLTRGIGDGI